MPTFNPSVRARLALTSLAVLAATAPAVAPAATRKSKPAPTVAEPVPAVAEPAPIPNCTDLTDFIRSGGAIPVKVPRNYLSYYMKGDDFRHEEPSSNEYARVPAHSDYSQQWVYFGERSGSQLLFRAHLHAHNSTYVRMECQDGRLLLEGVLENCDLYPKGMETDTVGRIGDTCVPARVWKLRGADGSVRNYDFVSDGSEYGGRMVPLENN